VKETDGLLPADQLEYVDLMYQMALINSGFAIEEPDEITNPLERLIRVGFKVDRDEPCEEIEIELDEPEQTEEAGDDDEEPEEINIDDLHDEL